MTKIIVVTGSLDDDEIEFVKNALELINKSDVSVNSEKMVIKPYHLKDLEADYIPKPSKSKMTFDKDQNRYRKRFHSKKKGI